MPTQKATLYPLTSLRFFFALAVFGHHCYFFFKSKDETAQWVYTTFLGEGFIGVSFFFVLSGFILAYNYYDRLGAEKGEWKNFYIARIARIYPLHLLTLGLIIPVSLSEFTDSTLWGGIAKLVSHLTLTQSYWLNEDVYAAFNSPSWSISDELFFYLCFPLIIVGLKQMYTHFGKGVLWLSLTVLLLPLAIIFTPVAWHHVIYYTHPVARIADFFLGILLYLVYQFCEKDAIVPLKGTILETIAIIFFIVALYFKDSIPLVYRYSSYYWMPMMGLILVFAFQKGFFSRLLSHPWLVFLGEISFAFYMLHRVIMRYYGKYKSLLFAEENPWLDTMILLMITVITSYLVYRFFERPALRWMRKKLGYQAKSV